VPPAPTGNTPATPAPPPDTGTPPPPPPPTDTGPKTEKKSLLSPPASMAPVFIGGGIAVVGIGVPIGVGVIAKSSAQNSADSVAAEIRKNGGTQGICSSTKTADVKKFGTACSALSDDNSKVDTDATVGNIALAVGIAGAAFAVGWYLFAPKRDEPGKEKTTETMGTWKAPVISPLLGSTNGLSLSGAF
jgi:hypothetical protein